MKTLFTLSILTLVLSSHASAEDFFYKGEPITKLDAIKTFIANPDAAIVRCTPVMLTDKATIKNRPKGKALSDLKEARAR